MIAIGLYLEVVLRFSSFFSKADLKASILGTLIFVKDVLGCSQKDVGGKEYSAATHQSIVLVYEFYAANRAVKPFLQFIILDFVKEISRTAGKIVAAWLFFPLALFASEFLGPNIQSIQKASINQSSNIELVSRLSTCLMYPDYLVVHYQRSSTLAWESADRIFQSETL